MLELAQQRRALTPAGTQDPRARDVAGGYHWIRLGHAALERLSAQPLPTRVSARGTKFAVVESSNRPSGQFDLMSTMVPDAPRPGCTRITPSASTSWRSTAGVTGALRVPTISSLGGTPVGCGPFGHPPNSAAGFDQPAGVQPTTAGASGADRCVEVADACALRKAPWCTAAWLSSSLQKSGTHAVERKSPAAGTAVATGIARAVRTLGIALFGRWVHVAVKGGGSGASGGEVGNGGEKYCAANGHATCGAPRRRAMLGSRSGDCGGVVCCRAR